MTNNPQKPDAPLWSPLEPPTITVLADHPILHTGSDDDDQLELHPKLSAIFDIMRNKRTQTPIALAIFGGWGTGKSSAMRWLRDRLRQWNEQGDDHRQGHARVETVWFDPWKYQTRDDVWRGLIAEVILGCLTAGDPPTRSKLEWIDRAARRFGAYVGRPFLAALSHIKIKPRIGDKEAGVEAEISGELFQTVLDELRKVRAPQEAFLNEFEEALRTWVMEFFPQDEERRAPRRLAVLIDDLDRCLPSVALQVMEALKLYLNIPGLLFVVGLDRQVLDAVVRREYEQYGIDETKSRDYLAKMFQVHVDIPPTQSEAKEFFKKQIVKLNVVSGYEWGNLLEASSADEPGVDHRQIIEERIVVLGRDNPREIKRLLNSALLRAWAAAQDTALNAEDSREEEKRRARRFAQGAQVFLVQRFLWRDFLQDGVLLRTQAQEFFARWSGFVARYPDFRPSELSREPFAEKEATQEAATTSELREIIDEDWQPKAPGKNADPRLRELDELERSQPVPQVLKNEDLWELMRIPFSVSVAGIVVAKPIPEHPDDEEPTGGTTTRRPRPPGREPARANAEAWPLPVRVAAARTWKKSVTDVTESDIRTLEHLDLSGNRELVDLTPLAGLSQLLSLHLSEASVTDLTPLAGLTQLQTLRLDQTGVTDLTPLADLTLLQHLDLDQTGVTDLTPLAGLTQLEFLSLNSTGVADLTPLAGLTRLKFLGLSQTSVSDLTPLASLTQLRDLGLSQTSVSDLTPLAGLTQLLRLTLNQTGVTDLAPLAGLTQLQHLWLRQTDVTDLTPLRKLEHVTVYLGEGLEVQIPDELKGRVRRV